MEICSFLALCSWCCGLYLGISVHLRYIHGGEHKVACNVHHVVYIPYIYRVNAELCGQ